MFDFKYRLQTSVAQCIIQFGSAAMSAASFAFAMYANTINNFYIWWWERYVPLGPVCFKQKTYKLNSLKKAATNSPTEIRGQTATELMYLITNQNTDYGGGILVDHWSTIFSYVLRAGKWQK